MIPLLHTISDTGISTELTELVRSARLRLDPDAGCGHVGAMGGWCVHCPEQGVLCLSCGDRHHRDGHSHDPGWSNRCDRCGEVDEQVHDVLVSIESVLHRRRRIIVGSMGVALCRGCAHVAMGRSGGVG